MRTRSQPEHLLSHHVALLRPVEIEEASMALQFAMNALNPTERAAMTATACDLVDTHVANELGLSRAAIYEARKTAVPKIRRRLALLGITSTSDLLSG